MVTSLAHAKIAEVCIIAVAHTFMRCIINGFHNALLDVFRLQQMISAEQDACC